MLKVNKIGRTAKYVLAFLAVLCVIVSCSVFEKKTKSSSGKSASAPKVQAGLQKTSETFTQGDLSIGEITDMRQLPYGMWVTGSYGDFLLKNKKITIVVSQLEKGVEDLLSGGNIIDAARTEDPVDMLGHCYFKYGNNIPPSYKYEKAGIKTGGYPNNGAALVVSGKDTTRPIFIQTEYILEPTASYLRIVTTIENKSTETLQGFNCADHVNYGAMAAFIEGKGSPNPDKQVLSESNWLGAQRDNLSIGFTQKSDIIKGLSQNNASDISYKMADIQPGQKYEFERYMYIADRNLSTISDFVYDLRKIPCGSFSGKVVNPDTKEGIGDVDVQISVMEQGKDKVPMGPFTRCYSSSSGVIGSFNVKVPAGKYFIRSKPFARQTPNKSFSIKINANETYAVELQVSDENKVKYKIVDKDTKKPIPCKITFQAIPPTQPLDFGFPKSAAGRNAYCSAVGSGEIVMPSGNYRVFISRGLEYEVIEKDYTFGFGRENLIEGELKKVIESDGYIAVDIGVKTNASFDCPVAAKDRLIQAAAEGVEVLISGDMNTATDLEPIATQLGLDKAIKTIIGKRIVFTGKDQVGEFSVFPISKEGVGVTKGDEELKTANPEEFFKILRRKYTGALIQLNRPIFPFVGYFTNNGYDPTTKDKLAALPKIPMNFDLFDLWEGKKGGTSLVQMNTQLYFDILMKNYKPGLTVSTNSNFVFGEELGYPRTYVACSQDDPSKVAAGEIIDSLKKGKTIVTNGPFIKFTVNGKGPGEVVTATDGVLNCYLEITAAPWIDTSFIDINKDGIFSKRVYQAPSDKVLRYPREGTENKREFRLETKRDVLLNIVVGGKRSMDPIVSPLFYGEGGGIIAWAVTSPIFVDFDGNGKYDGPTDPDSVGN